MGLIIRVGLCLFALQSFAATEGVDSRWYKINAQGKAVLKMELFMSDNCPYCLKAEAFLNKIATDHRWIEVNKYVINKSKKDLVYFDKVMHEFDLYDYQVPSIFFCGVRWLGFESEETSGATLMDSLRFCREKIEAEGQLTATNQDILKRWALGPFQEMANSKEGGWLFIVGMALMDAISPCSLFALGLFISFLYLFPGKKQRMMSGLLMIAALFMIHYTQQAETVIYQHALTWLRWLTVIAGIAFLIIMDQLLRHKKFLKTPALVLSFTGFFLVYLYQQSCFEKNISLIFQKWMETTGLSALQQSLYQLVFQVIYIIPALLLLAFILIFLSGKRALNLQETLKYSAFSFLLACAVILIVNPTLFSHLALSILVLVVAVLFGWTASIYQRRRHL